MSQSSTTAQRQQPVPQVGRTAIEKHPGPNRWMHWINFPLLTIMIWSGLRIYWADRADPFGVGIGFIGWHWFDLFPDSINEKLGLNRTLARGMAFHFTVAWLFTLNGVAYGLYLWRSGGWRHILPERESLGDAAKVVVHDLHLSKAQLPPQGRYNGAQRWSYTLILFLGVIAVLTGLSIYKPTQLSFLTALFGGYEMARSIHFFVTLSFVAFFIVHIVQVAMAGFGNFWSMVSGYEMEEIGPSSTSQTELEDDNG